MKEYQEKLLAELIIEMIDEEDKEKRAIMGAIAINKYLATLNTIEDGIKKHGLFMEGLDKVMDSVKNLHK